MLNIDRIRQLRLLRLQLLASGSVGSGAAFGSAGSAAGSDSSAGSVQCRLRCRSRLRLRFRYRLRLRLWLSHWLLASGSVSTSVPAQARLRFRLWLAAGFGFRLGAAFGSDLPSPKSASSPSDAMPLPACDE